MPSMYIDPDWYYVNTRMNELRWELQGFHTKISEIEALRYYENIVHINKDEVKTGQKVRIGLTAELMENIKAAILAVTPTVRVEPLRDGDDAVKNAENREHLWQGELDRMMGLDGLNANLIAELADSQMLGLGVYKSSKSLDIWDPKERKRKKGESHQDHVNRVNAYKKKQGLPIADGVVHPLATFFRPGEGAKVQEIIEHSYKPKSTVYGQYSMTDHNMVEYQSFKRMPGWKGISNFAGQPDTYVRPLPAGVDTTNYFLVTEYWNPDVYKVFVNSTEVYKESPPNVCYFMAPGRSSSSKDPDKYAISVAESLRHNEPLIDRLLTRMIEAAELIVNKHLTIETPEGYSAPMEMDADGNPIPETFTFTDDKATTLPPGAKIIDPYEGANQVYQAMPLAELLMQIAGQHGISPLFKGISPGAAGSGYRDNSLYLMAKSLIQYIIGSLQGCLTAIIRWKEDLVAYGINQEVWLNNYSLTPTAIKNYPTKITVTLNPSLPQNLIATGEFWERQRQAGNVSRRYVREHGLELEQPGEMQMEVDLETAFEMMKPILIQRVLGRVIAAPPASGLVGPDGKTPIASDPNVMAGAGVPTKGMGQNGAGRELAGSATGGQPKAPNPEPMEYPPGNRENR